jgi:hypothetical protein
VARQDAVEAAFATLPSRVAAKLSAGGKPDAAFVKLYDALQDTQPTM